MVKLTLSLHASNFAPKFWHTVDGGEYERVTLDTIDDERGFCEHLVEKILACLHCLTKGIYDIDEGFCEPWQDFYRQMVKNLNADVELNDNGKRSVGADADVSSPNRRQTIAQQPKKSTCNALDNLLDFLNGFHAEMNVSNISLLSQYIQQVFYEIADAKPSSIRKANNEYLINLFRAKIRYTDGNIAEFNLLDLNNARSIKFADIESVEIVSFEQFEYYGSKTIKKRDSDNRMFENPALFWVPVMCNFTNKEVKKNEEYENTSIIFSKKFNTINMVGQMLFDSIFCRRDEFIQRIRKYEPITSLVENDNYKNSFFQLKPDSSLYMPSLIFYKHARNGNSRSETGKFELPAYSDFIQNCHSISRFFEFYGFLGEQEYLKNFPQTLPPLKPLTLKTLKATLADLHKYSRSVYDKIDFNFNNLVQFTPLQHMTKDIQRHRERSGVGKGIEEFIQHIDKFEETRPEDLDKMDPKELNSFIKTYNELAKRARCDGKYTKII